MNFADFQLYNQATKNSGKYIKIYFMIVDFNKNNCLLTNMKQFPLELLKSVAFFSGTPGRLEKILSKFMGLLNGSDQNERNYIDKDAVHFKVKEDA